MANRSLIPWRRRQESDLETWRERDPFLRMQDEMDRMFDTFFERPSGLRTLERTEGFWPSMDVYETEKEITIQTELPGIDEKDINLSLNQNVLTISGKKESEEVEKGKSYYRRERSYGQFQRSIELPEGVDEDQIDAVYEKGILKIVVNKPQESVSISKRIKIKKG
ncbi:MAG: Hsp20/alpha crystallin family protein [Anaerolineales bacterium]